MPTVFALLGNCRKVVVNRFVLYGALAVVVFLTGRFFSPSQRQEDVWELKEFVLVGKGSTRQARIVKVRVEEEYPSQTDPTPGADQAFLYGTWNGRRVAFFLEFLPVSEVNR